MTEQINVKNNVVELVPLLEHDVYEIFNQYPFTIRSKFDHYSISETLNGTGYFVVQLNQRLHLKHVLIAKQFISNPNNYHFVDHVNHDKTNYHLSNLLWVTHSQNMFNRSLFKGVQYEFVDDIPEESIKILFYDT